MKNILFFKILMILLITFASCESERLDLKENWIKVKYFTNSLESDGKAVDTDTVRTSINDEFLLRIYTQIQPKFKLSILINTFAKEFIDITDLPGYATLSGYFEEDGVQRKINTIEVSLDENFFNYGDEIIYLIRIESSSEMIEKKLVIKINPVPKQ